MFFEEIGDITAEHLRSHIPGYLAILQERYPDSIKLKAPKSIETANLVGGVYNATPNDMPAYVVDLLNKEFAGDSDASLWLYNYTGHIAGVVSGMNEETTNRLCKRHEQAVETFVREHGFMHNLGAQIAGNEFTLISLGFIDAALSGAELLDDANGRQVWIAGFRVDINWLVSENGPGQH